MLTNEMVKTFSNEELVEEYLAIKAQEDQLKKDKEVISELIKSKLEKGEVLKNNQNILKLEVSRTFEYDDEPAIIDYLKKHKFTNFIKTTVNAPALNKELKKDGNTLAVGLKNYYHEKPVNKICIGKECE